MTDATLWLARSPGQDHEVLTTEVLRSRISMRSCLTYGTASLSTMCRFLRRPRRVARFI